MGYGFRAQVLLKRTSLHSALMVLSAGRQLIDDLMPHQYPVNNKKLGEDKGDSPQPLLNAFRSCRRSREAHSYPTSALPVYLFIP